MTCQTTIAVFVICAFASMLRVLNVSAAEPGPVVSGTRIESPRDPAVTIRLPEEMRYVGSERFTQSKPGLTDFDACMLYAFAYVDTEISEGTGTPTPGSDT
jgi:hypothetical protein